MNSEIEKVLAVDTLQPKVEGMDQQMFIDQFLKAQGRKFRRKFVKESFSDRFKKSFNMKQGGGSTI